jgi:hypothetical protein
LSIGNGVFVTGHFALGFAIGEPALELAGRAAGPLAAASVALAVGGLVAWWLIRRAGHRAAVVRQRGPSDAAASAAGRRGLSDAARSAPARGRGLSDAARTAGARGRGLSDAALAWADAACPACLALGALGAAGEDRRVST